MKKNVIAVIALVTLSIAVLFAAHFSGLIQLKASAKAVTTSSACSADDGHGHAKPQITEGHDDRHGDEKEAPVHLTDEQAKLIKIKISQAVSGNVDNTTHLNGELQLNMDETAKLMPRMPGFVTQVLVKEGDVVKRGQLLAILTSHKLGEYYSDYNSASELEKLTFSEFQMAEKLRKSNAMSEKEFLRYKREHADAMIARRRGEALLKSLLLDPAHSDHSHKENAKNVICTEYEIRAPFDGVVIAKDITVGENFPEDNSKVVFIVSNMKKLWLDLRANSDELKTLKPEMSVSVTQANSSVQHHGKIVYIAPLIDVTTRTGLVRVLLDNADGTLRPGEFATGIISTEANATSVIIPREAGQLISGETVVFVPQNDGFAPKVISIGKSAKGFTQVISGLTVGERYVSAGAFELKSVLLTSGMDPHAGHGH